MKRILLTLSFILVCAQSHAQFINEQVFPTMPYKEVSSSIVVDVKGFYITGRTGQTTAGVFDNWYTISHPYFIFSPAAQKKKVSFLPAREDGWFFGLGGNQNRISLSSVRTENDSFFVAWSNIDEEYTDVGPFVHVKSPVLHIAKYKDDSFDTVLTIDDGYRPNVIDDNQSTLHIVYEKVRPLDTSWNDRYTRYSSSITYQTRNSSGSLSDSTECGKGFFPSVKVRDGIHHVLFFQAESSNQIYANISYARGTGASFEPPVPLYKVFLNKGGPFSPVPPMYLQWDVDSAGGLQLVWRNYSFDAPRIFIIHYSSDNGISVDSLNDPYAVIEFSGQGTVNIVSAVQSDGIDSLQLNTYLSQHGIPLQKIHSATFRLQGSLNQIILGNDGSEHALITDGATSHLIKYASTDSAQAVLLSKEYTINSGAYVDPMNRVWLAGKRDSTPVLLNFSLDDVGTHEDFVFPLRVGNVSYYEVWNIEAPDPWSGFMGYDSITIVSGTIFTNEKKYFVLQSSMFPDEYLRKEGLKVYQYSFKDSAEFLRFNFSANEGDTIAHYGNHSYTQFALLQEIGMKHALGIDRISQTYWGVTPGCWWLLTTATDSIGILKQTDGLAVELRLIGGIINGKSYGTLVSVEDKKNQLPSTFSLSQNYPNPFNPSTTIEFQLPMRSHVSLKMYDVLGREVATLVNEKMNAGVHKATWNAANVSSGMYFARMTAGQFSETKKLLLMK